LLCSCSQNSNEKLKKVWQQQSDWLSTI